MATEEWRLNVNPTEWGPADKGFLPNAGEKWYYKDGLANFRIIGDGTSTVAVLIESQVAPYNKQALHDSTTTYSTLGTLVTKGFKQFSAYNVTGNLDKNPITSPDYWLANKGADVLYGQYDEGEPISGGITDISNRAGAQYRQNILVGKYTIGGVEYEFYRIALDGTVVTGDTTLEAIFDVGGGNEYFRIDDYAPDVVGTRTLIDMGERVLAAQSSSGENDTMGEELDDRTQGNFVVTALRGSASTPDFNLTSGSFEGIATGGTNNIGQVFIANKLDNGVDGTPREGLTTRSKELTVGASYIIVMIPA